jgi:hypothetical protein
MHRVAEHVEGRRFGIVAARLAGLVHFYLGLRLRCLAVGAPMPLVRAGRGVEHDDAVVAVAVGDVDLVRRAIDPDVGRRAQLRGVVIAAARAGLADLHHELAVAAELEHRTVLAVVAAEPDRRFVDANAVFLPRPIEALPGAAPSLHEVAFRIELDHRRGGNAADRGRRIAGAKRLPAREAARPMDDPDMIALVDRDTRDLADRPVVGQRLRPERIDLELRHLLGGGIRRPSHHERGRAESNKDEPTLMRRHEFLPTSLVLRAVFAARPWHYRLLSARS